jgi:hypothetical protein
MSKFVKDMEARFEESAWLATAPMGHELMRQAEQRCERISAKAVHDEYERLMIEKFRSQRRGFWSRLFGR